MRRGTFICAGLILGMATAAAGQTRSENWKKCAGQDPAARLDGCLAIILAGGESRLNAATAHFNRGTAAFQLGQDDMALANFGETLRLDATYAPAHFYRALVYLRRGQFDRALADFGDYIKEKPRDAKAYLARAAVYGKLGEPEKALVDLDKVLRLDRQNLAALLGRGAAYSDMKKYDLALAEFSAYLQRQPDDPVALVDRAAAYVCSDQFDKAIADYDEALRLKPDLTDALEGRGSAYLKSGQFDRAIADFDKAINLRSAQTETFFVRGTAKFVTGSLDGAAADFRSFIEMSSPSSSTFPYAVLWQHVTRERLGQDDAAELAQQAAKLDLAKWPGPVLKFYIGEMTAEQLKAAAADPDAEKQKGHVCEANFYEGERALWRGEQEAGAALLAAARDGCPRKFLEYDGAVAELSRLAVK